MPLGTTINMGGTALYDRAIGLDWGSGHPHGETGYDFGDPHEYRLAAGGTRANNCGQSGAECVPQYSQCQEHPLRGSSGGKDDSGAICCVDVARRWKSRNKITPGAIRTRDLQIRNLLLYPTELRGRFIKRAAITCLRLWPSVPLDHRLFQTLRPLPLL